MPATKRTPRDRWVNQGLRALAAGGPEAVRIEVLAVELGVTKGGFYGCFGDRSAFLAELLDEWERRCIDDTLASVEAEGGAARERIVRAGQLTFAADLVPVDLAVREWARRDPSVAERLRRVDNRRISYLREMFASFIDDPDEVEARSTLAFALAVGQHLMATDHGTRSRQAAIHLAADSLLATGQGRRGPASAVRSRRSSKP